LEGRTCDKQISWRGAVALGRWKAKLFVLDQENSARLGCFVSYINDKLKLKIIN
jgi:hypothetical protein